MRFDRRAFLVGAGAAALAATAGSAQQRRLFDSHCHIIDHRFPIVANQGYVPPDFPLLLIVGAVAIDVISRYLTRWNRWAQAAILGVAFFAAFIAVQWPFANFLMAPASHNWFFNTGNYPYFIPSTSPWVRNVFVYTDNSTRQFWILMTISMMVSIFMMGTGLAWGDWMRRIRR